MPFFRKYYTDILIYVLVFLIGVFLVVDFVIPPSPFGVLGASIYTAIVKPTPTQTIEEGAHDLLEEVDFSTPTPEYEEQPQSVHTIKAQTIDCIGQDGKHLQITKQECDAFNVAWKKPPQNTKPQTINQQTQLILDNAKNNAKYFTAQACLNKAKWEADSCTKACSDESTQGLEICRFGHDNNVWGEEDRYEECIQEVSAKQQTCGDVCTNTMISKQNHCLEEQKN